MCELTRVVPRPEREAVGTRADPVMLEVFNNLYMSIAEQMGAVLENTAASVTIKERLDFSCAVFDAAGDLIANAPHMPVHLGSMGASVKAIIAQNPEMAAGRRLRAERALQRRHAPARHHRGARRSGTTAGARVLFFTAARGHHTDVGGLTPGSMPPDSRTIHDEGAYIDNWKLVDARAVPRGGDAGAAARGAVSGARRRRSTSPTCRAQVAACEKGAQELGADGGAVRARRWSQAYMGHVQDNAEECVRRAIEALKDAEYVYPMDPDFDGRPREIRVRIDASTGRRGRR